MLAAALVAVVPAACGRATDAPPWPPPVTGGPEGSPVLSPDEAMATFAMPPGYRLELVAAEPMVTDPIWMDIDADGRLWVIEMRGFMPTPDERNTTREPLCRIVVLEDEDDDGVVDRVSVFLDDLILPRSLKVLDRGVLIAEPPNLWLVRDTTGDLVGDTRELVSDNFGRFEANPEHNPNGLLWGLDNWIYTSEHDEHFRYRNGTIEPHPTVRRGQWGVGMDDVGRIYRNWNEQPAFVDLVPGRYYARNPNLVRTRGSYEMLMDNEDMVVWPIRPTRGINRGYREGMLHEDGTLTTYTSAGTPTVYRGDRLPEELHGNLFVTESAGNLVKRLILEEVDGELRARNAYARERGEFLASTDERFRPVNLFSAPDGTLYVVDMYRGIIQEGQYQTEYLRNYIRTHGLGEPVGLGRIYRVVHETTERDRKPALSSAPADELVALLAHPNGWWRDTAQRLLVERAQTSAVPALTSAVSDAPDPRTRLHALGTLDGLEALDAATVTRALADDSADVRAFALRLAEPWLGRADHPLQAAALARMDDPHPTVRRQLAASLGALPPGAREPALATLLRRFADDPVAVDAAISGLAGYEADVLARLLDHGGDPALQDPLMALAGAVARADTETGMAAVVEWATDDGRADWQQLALLTGLEAGLPGPRRPGGAPPDAPIAARAMRGGPTTFSLPTEPAALVALATEEGEIGQVAERVLARVDWPGKPAPADAAPVEAPPLTAEEETRFAAGEEVYRNLCVACHQPDGEGLPMVAPTLVGSRWVVEEPGVAARIVLNGKEGQWMMPPLDSLSDEEIAAVLTFIRRSWGHTASAVGPAFVGTVRAASAGRTRPWTEQELVRVADGEDEGLANGRD